MLAKGRLVVGFHWTMTALHAEHDVDDDQFEPQIPSDGQARRHVLDFALMNWSVSALYGITDWIGAELDIPLRINVAHASFEDAAGKDMPDFQSIHHRDETLFGLGDITAGARIGVIRPKEERPWTLDLRAGLSLPTGNTEDNPFARGRNGLEHQHIFFGSGTFNPVFGFETSYAFNSLSLAGWSNVQLSLYENTKGYQASTQVAAGIGVQSGFGLEAWRFLLQPEVFHETSAKWDGEAARNSGRTDLILTGGVFWTPSPAWQVHVLVKIPYWRRVAGGQLNLPILGVVGVTYFRDLIGDDRHHE